MTSGVPATPSARRDALAEQLSAGALGALDLMCVYIGDRLGLYRTLADAGPLTAAELAAAASIEERYAREWLEQQAMSGILDVDDVSLPDDTRRFNLPAGHDEVLLEETSVSFMAPMAQVLAACTRPLDLLLDAFRHGGGVPFAAYGDDMHEGQARSSRVLFDNFLAREWLPGIPAIHERLVRDPPARIADLACGQGHSSIVMARAYPTALVDGIDLDETSVARARERLAGSGVEDRVTFRHADAAAPELAGRYDLVTIFEALHDMSYPVQALRAARGLLVTGGCVLLADERTAERFSLDAGDTERLHYGFSVLHCLPVGMIGENAAGTGTVMRPDTVRRYASEAGFARVDVLPIENDDWRLYRLIP
jgi:SAM-dependent methyltransferase